MARYVLLSKLTADGYRTLHKNPGRLNEVNQEMMEFGCMVVAQYAVLGEYDFVSIVEGPDNATIAHMSIDLASRGTMTMTSLPAISLDEFIDVLKGPQQLGRE